MKKGSLIFTGNTYPYRLELKSFGATYRGITRDWYLNIDVGEVDRASNLKSFLKKLKRLGVTILIVSEIDETDEEIVNILKQGGNHED